MITIFYYRETMNDTMTLVINNNKPTKVENHGEYSILFHDDILIGINVFNVSKKINLPNGFLYPDDKIINLVDKLTNMNVGQYNNPKFIVGRIDEIIPVPNTNLNQCLVFNGYAQMKIICGATNVKKDSKVVVANAGAALPSGIIINISKVMNVESEGMLCSRKELFNEDQKSDGILILNDTYKVGSEFKDHYKNIKA